MRRRDFIAAIYAAALAPPLGAAAQQPGKVWRIGDVLPLSPDVGAIFGQALERSLADLGYVEGRNIVLLTRYTGSRPEEMQEAITSLVPQADLLVVWGNAAIEAKKSAGAVPTVFI
jgi:putative ABC transport system substrate-binding protein